MAVVYIAGPITGNDNYAEDFARWEQIVKDAGDSVIAMSSITRKKDLCCIAFTSRTKYILSAASE